jgi:hypothetical protein
MLAAAAAANRYSHHTAPIAGLTAWPQKLSITPFAPLREREYSWSARDCQFSTCKKTILKSKILSPCLRRPYLRPMQALIDQNAEEAQIYVSPEVVIR